MHIWVAFKIPRAGYLDPHPISLSADVTISLGFVEQISKVILPIRLKEISLSKVRKSLFLNIKLKTWVGVKIPRAGYLDPLPLSMSVDVTNSLGFIKQSYKSILPIQLNVNQHSLARKLFFPKNSKCIFGGGGVRMGYLDPLPLSLSVDVTLSLDRAVHLFLNFKVKTGWGSRYTGQGNLTPPLSMSTVVTNSLGFVKQSHEVIQPIQLK